MPGRRKDLRPKTGVGVPGADAYSPGHTLVKEKHPAYPLGKSKRDGELKIFHNTPGSGHYHVDNSVNMTKSHSASWK